MGLELAGSGAKQVWQDGRRAAVHRWGARHPAARTGGRRQLPAVAARIVALVPLQAPGRARGGAQQQARGLQVLQGHLPRLLAERLPHQRRQYPGACIY